MNWRHDPRIKKMLERSTLESLLKLYFQRIYDEGEVQEMENALKNALNKYTKKDELYEKLLENNENEIEPLISEFLDSICETTLNPGQDHTPETLLLLAKLFIRIGDFRLACEILWCCASLAIQEFIADHELNVRLHSHNGKRAFARALSDDIARRFSVFEACHSSFYTNSHSSRDVNFAVNDANEFIEVLHTFHLADEHKKQLEKENFNC